MKSGIVKNKTEFHSNGIKNIAENNAEFRLAQSQFSH
tara:strand:- start:666 stop:776 length:111 start_codon:yes stop_codon:yes gene_type:complete